MWLPFGSSNQCQAFSLRIPIDQWDKLWWNVVMTHLLRLWLIKDDFADSIVRNSFQNFQYFGHGVITENTTNWPTDDRWSVLSRYWGWVIFFVKPTKTWPTLPDKFLELFAQSAKGSNQHLRIVDQADLKQLQSWWMCLLHGMVRLGLMKVQ